jgi:CRP/FNR family cyclic AMP-dependent transcriptional regulator
MIPLQLTRGIEVLPIDKLDLIKGNILFRDLDPALINPIAELGIRRKLAANQCLFVKGDDGDALYGVLSGSIRISVSAPSGKGINLNMLYPGDMFGEIALLDGNKRTADATAMEATELLCIQRPAFLKLMRDEPDLAVHLLYMLCDRLRKTSEIVEDTAFLGLGPRLAKGLLNLVNSADQSGATDGPVVLNISQSELGQMMGVSRESINKCLRSWSDDKWISLNRSQITILQEDALQYMIEKEERG